MVHCDCHRCLNPMNGIVSYDTREVCYECGGKAFMDHRETLLERRRKRGESPQQTKDEAC